MPVLSNFILAVARVLDLILTIYMWIIIIRALISWVNPDPYNPIVQFLYKITEPVLSYVRRILPAMGGIDLSPLLVLIAIIFLQQFFVSTLLEYGYSLKTGALR